MLPREERAHDGGLAHARVEFRRDPRTGIRHERGGRHRVEVVLTVRIGELRPFIIPAVHVLHKARGALFDRRGKMAHRPPVVEPDIETVQPKIEEVVEVLAARDERVERHTHVCAGMHGKASAAHIVGTRDARPAERPTHPLVEFHALCPPAVRDARF